MIQNPIKKTLFIISLIIVLFVAGLLQVVSEGKTLISELEKTEISQDQESQDLLKEYYGELLGYVKEKSKFNSIASKGDLAVLSVTIDGKDKRILTRLRTATLFPGQIGLQDPLEAKNLLVFGNISLKGILFADIDKSYGERSFFGVDSTTLRYVDEGFARIVDGKANISINPILRELIDRYNVFLTAEGLTKGIYVSEKTESYFIVKSVNPDSNVGFSWMLRGIRNKFRDEYLNSKYGQDKGIKITATINIESGSTDVKIEGLDNIFKLVNETSNNNEIIDNNSINETINNNEADENLTIIETDNITALGSITGQVIDEAGLETDLSGILGDPVDLSDVLEDNGEETGLNETTSIVEINDSVNLTEEVTVLEFTIFSVDEDYILDQIAFVTGLRVKQVRKLVDFIYKEPEGFGDEVIEDVVGFPEGIEKINGSIIIRVG